MRRALIGAGVVGLLVAMFSAGPASASTPDVDVDPQVAAVLDAVPGGVVIDSHHAVWPELDMELVVPQSSGVAARAAVGRCADARVCVFSAPSLSGAILSWGTCGSHAIPTGFFARSLADGRATGSAHARFGTTVLASAPAWGWANIPSTPDNVICYF